MEGNPEKAPIMLGQVLTMPYYLRPGWLMLDATFGELSGNPRFDRLLQ